MDDFYKELKELDEKIKLASGVRDVTSPTERKEAFEARTDELKVLIREQIKILERKHGELSEWIESINKETEKPI